MADSGGVKGLGLLVYFGCLSSKETESLAGLVTGKIKYLTCVEKVGGLGSNRYLS